LPPVPRTLDSKKLWCRYGELGLIDRSSTPHHSPRATPVWVVEQIEAWRRTRKWSAQRITLELAGLGYRINRRTVARHSATSGLSALDFSCSSSSV